MRRTVLPNTLAICEINPHETRFLYNEIFVQKTYMKHGVEISPGDTIIDAGANIGLFALFALVNFNPARVFCFEPATHCLEALRFNLAAWAIGRSWSGRRLRIFTARPILPTIPAIAS